MMAVSGVLLSAADALVILAALEGKQDIRPNERVVMVNLRRTIAKSGVSNASTPKRHLPDSRISNASSNARKQALQANSAHSGDRETLGSNDAAAALGITPNAVRDLRRRGSLHAEYVGGRWRFDAAEVQARATSHKE